MCEEKHRHFVAVLKYKKYNLKEIMEIQQNENQFLFFQKW